MINLEYIKIEKEEFIAVENGKELLAFYNDILSTDAFNEQVDIKRKKIEQEYHDTMMDGSYFSVSALKKHLNKERKKYNSSLLSLKLNIDFLELHEDEKFGDKFKHFLKAYMVETPKRLSKALSGSTSYSDEQEKILRESQKAVAFFYDFLSSLDRDAQEESSRISEIKAHIDYLENFLENYEEISETIKSDLIKLQKDNKRREVQ